MIQIQSLGGIDLRGPDGAAVRLRSRKHVALLVYLAASGRRSFTREHLAELIWDSAPERARHSLSQAVYDLRNHADGVLERAPGDQLALDPTRIRLDAAAFEAAVREGRLREAVEIYRGPFAPSLTGAGTREFDRWLDAERVRLRRLAEAALRRHVAESESKGLWGEMYVAALKLVDMSPLDEEAHRSLMRGLWLHGDPAAALEHYEAAVELLRHESSEGVSDETRDLARRIRAAPLGEPAGGGPLDREGPIVGRDAEFDLLRGAVRDMGRGRATAVLVAGEAGIGKSRLLREFRRSLVLEEAQLIESRCYPGEEELPYGPVIEGLAPIAAEVLATSHGDRSFARLGYLLPDFPQKSVPEDQGVDPSAWRRRLYEEVATVLRLATEKRAIIWTIDDVQWMDATSAGLFHYVSRRLQGSRFLLVATIRAPRSGKLPSRLPVTPPDGSGYTTEIRLQPLPDDQIEKLLLHYRPDGRDHPALELAKHLAAGNPFYALEVFLAALTSQDWAEDAKTWDPLNDERLRRVLAVRFKGLPEGANRILQSAAVLERNSTPRLLATVSGIDLDDAADDGAELYARGIIFDDENRIDFINDLMREYVYTEMSGLRRTALHLRAARALEREPDASPGRLARHFLLGDDREPAYRYAMEAARRAAESGGHEEAASMAGLARAAAFSLEQEIGALWLMAESELASAQLAGAREHLAEILRLQPELPPEEVIRIKLKMVVCLTETSNWQESRTLLESIRDELRGLSLKSAQVLATSESLYWGLKVAIRQSDPEMAEEISSTLKELSSRDQGPDQDSIETHLSILSCEAVYKTFFESSSAAEEYLKRAVPFLADAGQEWSERIRLLQGMVSSRQANWDEAFYYFSEVERLAKKRNDLLQLTAVWNNLACWAMEQGDWVEVDRQLGKVEEAQRKLPDPLDVALLGLLNGATACFYQGKNREAEALFARALNAAQTVGAEEFVPQMQGWLVLTQLQRGDTSSAMRTWKNLQGRRMEDSRGAQEFYHLEWLHAFIGRHEPDARERLRNAALIMSDLDRVSSWKLRCIDKMVFEKNATPEPDLRQVMSQHRLSWFPHFLQRWSRMVRAWRPS
ncbi:MAG: AAA family ATPase [Gemmatimonadota bacterium]